MGFVILGQLRTRFHPVRTGFVILGWDLLSYGGLEPGSPLLGGRFSPGKARERRPKIFDLTYSYASPARTAVLPDPPVVLGRAEDGSI